MDFALSWIAEGTERPGVLSTYYEGLTHCSIQFGSETDGTRHCAIEVCRTHESARYRGSTKSFLQMLRANNNLKEIYRDWRLCVQNFHKMYNLRDRTHSVTQPVDLPHPSNYVSKALEKETNRNYMVDYIAIIISSPPHDKYKLY